MIPLPLVSRKDQAAPTENYNFQPLSDPSVQKLLDAFQQPTALLDNHEKVIAVNINFLRLFSYPDAAPLMGKKPVDIFKCISASETICNNPDEGRCYNCGRHLNHNGNSSVSQPFTDSCHLTFADEPGHPDDLHNMKVTTSPFSLDQQQFYLFSITDISNDVRRRLLDKIFYHDVLNKAGNIVGLLDILNHVGNDDNRSDELYQTLKSTSRDLINEIKYQRDLTSAENNELVPVFLSHSSLDMLYSIRKEMANSAIAQDREISIFRHSPDQKIVTDDHLLRRVLINMLKNALEATEKGGKVILGCDRVNEQLFRFWVHNDQPVPLEIQEGIFRKFASTKGINRGIGTFSMRLIGEKYLNGKVNFVSSTETGTYFMIDLPVDY